MDQDDFNRMLIEVHSDLKVTKTLMENFVNNTFPLHVKDDEHTRSIANKATGKINKIFYSVSGAAFLLMAAEGARALGWFA